MEKQINPEKVFAAYNAEIGLLANQIVLLKAQQTEFVEEIDNWSEQVHNMTQENNELQIQVEQLQFQISELSLSQETESNLSQEGEIINEN